LKFLGLESYSKEALGKARVGLESYSKEALGKARVGLESYSKEALGKIRVGLFFWPPRIKIFYSVVVSLNVC